MRTKLTFSSRTAEQWAHDRDALAFYLEDTIQVPDSVPGINGFSVLVERRTEERTRDLLQRGGLTCRIQLASEPLAPEDDPHEQRIQSELHRAGPPAATKDRELPSIAHAVESQHVPKPHVKQPGLARDNARSLRERSRRS